MESTVAVDGARLSWTVEGAGEPLLLIAGQATGLAGWDPVIPELSKTFRVIRFDHRGIAASTEGDLGRYSTRAFAEDAATVLDAAGAPKAHVYGHSMGGRVAQWLAIDHADRVATLVLAATSAGGA
ncbi:alpha/beta fold hydrolase, partial [Arthrobacter sp. H5]|uniref:alpha/beta fold hydrolase n=1 Tax=Arthrobacter sp. H5 TaxID=1267973 RepID=UPI0020A66372